MKIEISLNEAEDVKRYGTDVPLPEGITVDETAGFYRQAGRTHFFGGIFIDHAAPGWDALIAGGAFVLPALPPGYEPDTAIYRPNTIPLYAIAGNDNNNPRVLVAAYYYSGDEAPGPGLYLKQDAIGPDGVWPPQSGGTYLVLDGLDFPHV